jgi:hypothetical protein
LFADLPRDTADRFKNVIAALNAAVRVWKRSRAIR